MKTNIAKRCSVILFCGFVSVLVVRPVFADFNGRSGESRWQANRLADNNQSPWSSRKIENEEQRNPWMERRERSESQPSGPWKKPSSGQQRKEQQAPRQRTPDGKRPSRTNDGKKHQQPRRRDGKPEQRKVPRREHSPQHSPQPRREETPYPKWKSKPIPIPDQYRTPRDHRRDEPRSERRDQRRHDEPRHRDRPRYDTHKHREQRLKHRRPHRYEHARHRPRYKYYKRHRHVYYRSPWYSTWFLAPIIWHFHSIGYELLHLPKGYIRIVVRGLPYFYFDGVFYRPYRGGYIVVSAPIGAYVEVLPLSAIAFSIGLGAYYYANDTYYMWDEYRTAYVVVEKPVGAEQAMEDATQGRLFVYPNEGQDKDQQAKDRYECHRWAVSATGVDPTLVDSDLTLEEEDNYKRAISACLEGRGYTVK